MSTQMRCLTLCSWRVSTACGMSCFDPIDGMPVLRSNPLRIKPGRPTKETSGKEDERQLVILASSIWLIKSAAELWLAK